MTQICNICGSKNFTKMHNVVVLTKQQEYRLDKSYKCTNCSSLERHRIIKSVMDQHYVPKSSFAALVFSDDPCVYFLKKLFNNLEISIFGGNNSIDIQNIDRENNTYDFIFHHHVLEHVENDKKAFSELCRILKPGGKMIWSVSAPTMYKTSKEYGAPDPQLYDHWRHYGRDFILIAKKIWSKENNLKTNYFLEEDTVTGFLDCIFISEKNYE